MSLGGDSVMHVALLVARVGVGLTLAAHGYNKFYGGGRIPGTAGWFESIGMKPGKLHAYLAAYTEIVAGIFLALGLLTSFAAAGFVGVMMVAGLLVHRKSGFFIVGGGWEYTFILGLIPVVIAMLGPGKYSFDHIIEPNTVSLAELLDGWVGLAISAGVGIITPLILLAIFYRPDKTAAQ